MIGTILVTVIALLAAVAGCAIAGPTNRAEPSGRSDRVE